MSAFRFFILFLVAFLCGAHIARSQDSQASDLGFGGTATPLCSFTALPSELAADNMSLTAGGSNKIQIDTMIDPSSSLLKPSSIQIEIIGTCNQTHYVSVMTRNGGLALSSTAQVVDGAFLSHVNYRTQVNWAGKTAVMSTDGAPGKKTPTTVVGGTNHGPLSLRIIVDELENDMGMPVVAGTYSDILTVQIGAPL